MADNVEADPGSGGAIFGTFSDGSEHWPGAALIYITGGSAGSWTVQKVDSTHGLPVTPLGGTMAQVTLVPTVTSVTSIGTMSTLTTLTSITNVVHVDDNSSTLSVDDGGGSLTIDGSLTNISGTITLPTGASTAAKQPALGTAGSASTDVITIQGIASMTKLLVTPDLPSGASTAAKQPALGTAGSASTDVITIQGIASMTPLLVTPAANSAVNVAQINGVTVLMGNGASGTGAQRVTIANDSTGVVGLNAGSALIGKAIAHIESSSIYDGTTAMTPKFAKISTSTSGDLTLVSAVTSKKIRVTSMALFGVGTAASIYFRDGVGGTAIFADGTNPIPIDKSGAAGAGGFVLSFNPAGWMTTGASSPLVINVSAAQALAGGLTYVEAS